MDSHLSQTVIQWLSGIGTNFVELCFYGLVFFALSLLMTESSSGKPALLHKVHKGGFIHEDFRLESTYFFFNLFSAGFIITMLGPMLVTEILPAILPGRIFAEEVAVLPFWTQLLLGLLVADTAFFIPHWLVHRFMWPFHAIHHSAKELRWITGVRLHPVDALVFSTGGLVIGYFIGFDGQAIILAYGIHTLYNYFVHANIALSYPKPLCYILVSPNYHRWHHATDKAAMNKNIATMFPLLDLICGSYYHPEGKLPKKYGIYTGPSDIKVPSDFLGQLLYPFRRRKRRD